MGTHRLCRSQLESAAGELQDCRGQIVPLSAWAVREFQALRALAGDSPWVLPGQEPGKFIDPKLLTRGLAKCGVRFRRQGIAAFHLHDLRRTCRTGLAKLRIPPHIAERVLNHAQERIASTYDVYDYLDERRAALDAWRRSWRHWCRALVASRPEFK